MSTSMPQIPEILYEMGARMKKYSTWNWIILGSSIIVSILVLIPIIIGTIIYEEIVIYIGAGIGMLLALLLSCVGLYLLYLYFQYMNSIKDLRDATNDPVFEKVYQYMLIGFILQFVGLSIVTFILNILCYIELEKWATRMEQQLPTPEMSNVTEGFKWMKIGTIVSICIPIAFIMIPIAYAKSGNALMNEYNSSKFGGIGTTKPYPMEVIGRSFTQAPPTQVYGAPQPQTQAYTTPTQSTQTVTCPHCGNVTPKHLAGKFCGKCGKSYTEPVSVPTNPEGQTYKPTDDIVRCPHCGAENPKGTVFCEVCGKSF